MPVAVKTVFHVRMRCRTVFVVFIPCTFLQLAVEQMPTPDLDRALQLGYLLVPFPQLLHQSKNLFGHRGHALVVLTKLFRKCGEFVREFRHLGCKCGYPARAFFMFFSAGDSASSMRSRW